MLENDERVKKCNFLSTSGGGRLGLDFFLVALGVFYQHKKIHLCTRTDRPSNNFFGDFGSEIFS